MVQDNLKASCGVAFMQPFFCNVVWSEEKIKNISVPEDLDMQLSIVANGNTFVFKRGTGLVEGFQPDGTLVIIWAMNDPCNLGKGTHDFHITANTSSEGIVLDESGKIKVMGVLGKKPSTDANWFDSFESRELVPDPPKDSGLPLEPGASIEVAENRMSICRDCPFFELDSGTCMQCGCYMPIKTTLEHSECPIGKW